MINLLRYKRIATGSTDGIGVNFSYTDIEKRFLVLREACDDGNLSLVKEVEKLEQCARKLGL